MLKYPGQAKIAEFDIVSCVQEDVGRFKITMKDSTPFNPLLTFVQSQCDLAKDLPGEVFFQVFPVEMTINNELLL